MRLLAILLICLPCVSFARVVGEEQTTFTYNGRTVPATIKTIERRSGTFQKMYIRVGPRTVSCIPGDQKDCEAAIRNSNSRGDR